jgi:Protein of unknown function DUF2625
MTYEKRSLEQLINREQPAWPLVQGWIADAAHPVDILSSSETAGESLVALQVTTRSPLGAVVFHTGGLLVDHGWLRFLGSGHPRLTRSLPGWNFACGMVESETPPPRLLIADDVVGGFFALNGGGMAAEGHTVWYFAPDTLTWEDTKRGYTDFLHWSLLGDLDGFYAPSRWPGWQADVARLTGDEAFSFNPPLSAQDGPIADRHRGPLPVAELFRLHVGTL